MEGEGENSVSKIGSLELLSTIGFEGKLQWNGSSWKIMYPRTCVNRVQTMSNLCLVDLPVFRECPRRPGGSPWREAHHLPSWLHSHRQRCVYSQAELSLWPLQQHQLPSMLPQRSVPGLGSGDPHGIQGWCHHLELSRQKAILSALATQGQSSSRGIFTKRQVSCYSGGQGWQ